MGKMIADMIAVKEGDFSFCYHFSWLFDDDFAVLLVGGMKYILMVVLV